MSNYGKLFSSWEISLKTSREQAKQCLPKIVKEINSAEKSLKGKIAYKLIVFLCKNFNDANVPHDIYSELFRTLVPFISNELWDALVQYFNYMLSVLVNKEQWTEIFLLLPLIEVKNTRSEDVIWIYFEIYKKPIALLIYREKYRNNLKENYFKQITKILHIAFDTKQQLFLDIATQIFGANNYMRHSITKHFGEAKDLLEDYIATLRNVKNLKDFDSFYISTTTIMRNLLNIEFEKSTDLVITLSFIKSFTTISENHANKSVVHVLSLFYYFIKLYNHRTGKRFNENLKEVFNKFIIILDHQNKNETWFMDTLVILTEILCLFSLDLRSIMTEENLIIAFEILLKLSKGLPNIKTNKTFCSYCTQLKRHEVINVAQTAVNLYRRVIEMDIQEKSIASAIGSILNYATMIYNDFKCANAEILLSNLCVSCFKTISMVQNGFQASYAIKLLSILEKFKINLEQSPGAIVYLYKKLYFHLKDYKSCMQMYCLYIAELLSKPNYNENVINDILLCSKMYESAGFDYGLSLCDILEENQIERVIPSYDKKLLLRLQLDVALKHYPTETSKQSLVVRILEKMDSDIEFALIVQKLGVLIVPNLLQRVENSISRLESHQKKLSNNKADIYLALGYLYKRLFIFKYESAKKPFGDKSVSESNLSDMDLSPFKKIAISIENDTMEAGLKSLSYLSNFYDNKKSCTVNFTLSDLIDCVSYLSRHFKLRGYLDHASKGWKLGYMIACEADCDLNKIRAISYFADVGDLYDYLKLDIDIKELIKINTPNIIKNFEEIDILTPRQQNYVLISILNIARYHASESDFDTCYILIEGVQQKLAEMESRKDSFELVAATLHAVNFVVNIKSKRNCFISPYQYAYYIMEQIRDIKYITSEDTVNIPSLLFDAVSEIAQFLINRLYASAVKPYLYMMLKFATSFGLTFRTTQILFLLAHIDLQMEKATECEIKLSIMDIVLENGKFDSKANLKKKTFKAPMLSSATPLFVSHDMVVEPIRKAAPSIAISPRNFKSPEADSEDLIRYLTSHDRSCACNSCKSPIFQMVYFQTGILRARHYYINKDFGTTKTFFEAALSWWSKKDNIYLKVLFRDVSVWMLMYYINTLRRVREYDIALQICDISLKYYEEYKPILDVAHFENTVEQKTSVEYIKKEKERKIVQLSNDTNIKELKNVKKFLQFSPPNTVPEKNVGTKEDLDLKLPKLEENNNEKINQLNDDVIVIPESPEVRIQMSKIRRRRKLQNCKNQINSPREVRDVQTPPVIFEKKANNQRKKLTEKNGEKMSKNAKQKEPKPEADKITRPRRKRV